MKRCPVCGIWFKPTNQGKIIEHNCSNNYQYGVCPASHMNAIICNRI